MRSPVNPMLTISAVKVRTVTRRCRSFQIYGILPGSQEGAREGTPGARDDLGYSVNKDSFVIMALSKRTYSAVKDFPNRTVLAVRNAKELSYAYLKSSKDFII